MRTLLNILWFILGGGFVVWLTYAVVGVVLCITVIGIPFGLQCFKIAGLGAFPFGKDIRHDRPIPVFSSLGNILWLILAGLWIFLEHVALALALTLTVVGIPFAYQHVKLALLALWPFGTVAALNER